MSDVNDASNALRTIQVPQEALVHGPPGIADQFAQAVERRLAAPWTKESTNWHNFVLSGRPEAPFGATVDHKIFVRPVRDNDQLARIMTRPIDPETSHALLAEFLKNHGNAAAEQVGALIEVSPGSVVVPQENWKDPFTIDGVGEFRPEYSVRLGPGRHWEPGFAPEFRPLAYRGPTVNPVGLGGMPVRLHIDAPPASSMEQSLIASAVQNLAALPTDVMDAAAPYVFENYRDMTDGYDEEFEALGIGRVTEAGGVWEEVVFLGRMDIITKMGEDDPLFHANAVYLIAECQCSWEQEHGLQLVFLNGERVSKVSASDGSPTTAADTGDPTKLDVVYKSWL